MLYFSLIDILFMLVGLLIGVAIMACFSRERSMDRCNNCVYKEVLEIMEGENVR